MHQDSTTALQPGRQSETPSQKKKTTKMPLREGHSSPWKGRRNQRERGNGMEGKEREKVKACCSAAGCFTKSGNILQLINQHGRDLEGSHPKGHSSRCPPMHVCPEGTSVLGSREERGRKKEELKNQGRNTRMNQRRNEE